jgi:hypothetical protein
MPMPVSATASSTQSRPSATSQRNLALFRELASIAQQIEQNLLEPQGIRVERDQVLLRFDDEAVLVLLGELSCGADNLVDNTDQIDRLRIRDRDGNPITGRPEMISEFQAGAGIAQTFEAVRAKVGGPISYAVIGLGAGSLTCQARPEDSAIYYEDPDVIRIARDPKLFNFVSECRPSIPSCKATRG